MEANDSFNVLKDKLCSAPVLIYPDFKNGFIIMTDASNVAVGEILSQGKLGEDRPIAYASRSLQGPEFRYPIYEKEALAIVFGVKHYRHFVYKTHFTIVTS